MSIGKYVAAAVMGTTLLISGCAGRHYYYTDGYARDRHYWNHQEERAYRRYLAERHERYRAFRSLDHNRQNDYWRWRHEHH